MQEGILEGPIMTTSGTANVRSLWRKRGGRTIVVLCKDGAKDCKSPSSIDDRSTEAGRYGRAPLAA